MPVQKSKYPCFHNIDQNSEEWDALRLGKFTASMFGDLFSAPSTLTYKKAIIRVAYEIVTGESEEGYSNKWMARGHEREPYAREYYQNHTFEDIENGGFWEYNKYVGASPDGKIVGKNGGIEIKCPSFFVYNEYLETQKLPGIYFWQVHGQMLCTGWDFVDFVGYSSPKLKPILVRVERDDEVLDRLREKLDIAVGEVRQMVRKIKA